MAIDILMPALSPTMEEGTLAKWLVKAGDKVSAGDLIAEIETDKATMEVEAADDGTVEAILVPAGTVGVKVNAVIARLSDGADAGSTGNSAGDAVASVAKGNPSPLEGEVREGGMPHAPSPMSATPPSAPVATTPPSLSLPLKGGEDPSSGAAGGPSKPAVSTKANGAQHRIVASPLARRLAKEAGIDLTGVSGSGPQGRIVKADIEAARKTGVAGKPAAQPTPGSATAASAPAAVADKSILAVYPKGSYELKPHDSLRRIIARRLTEAKQTIPHIYLTVDTEIDALMRLRMEINQSAPEGEDGKPVWRVSINDMVIKALSMALHDVPAANVTWTEAGMLHHRHADIGVAVAIPGGLITPVVRRAETKPLSEISNEMKDFAERARARKLLPEEYQGGSTSVSNLGMYGTREFAAVINPPQSSILAVGAGMERAVVHSGNVAVATVMTVTLSADHRAVDGAIAAELLKAFKRHIEKPAGMLV
ncbi:MAG: pyruvate dehydrogenase complex dihydrolipoamide acetyltransferase [Bauldia sp.]|nr:pyruvate dehydrogenase complex dihydrolipoamide acetyltransferase [Bauldia sp.]